MTSDQDKVKIDVLKWPVLSKQRIVQFYNEIKNNKVKINVKYYKK